MYSRMYEALSNSAQAVTSSVSLGTQAVTGAVTASVGTVANTVASTVTGTVNTASAVASVLTQSVGATSENLTSSILSSVPTFQSITNVSALFGGNTLPLVPESSEVISEPKTLKEALKRLRYSSHAWIEYGLAAIQTFMQDEELYENCVHYNLMVQEIMGEGEKNSIYVEQAKLLKKANELKEKTDDFEESSEENINIKVGKNTEPTSQDRKLFEMIYDHIVNEYKKLPKDIETLEKAVAQLTTELESEPTWKVSNTGTVISVYKGCLDEATTKLTNFKCDLQIFREADHYASNTSNRDAAGKHANEALKAFNDLYLGQNSSITKRLSEIYVMFNHIAGTREKLLSAFDVLISKASPIYKALQQASQSDTEDKSKTNEIRMEIQAAETAYFNDKEYDLSKLGLNFLSTDQNKSYTETYLFSLNGMEKVFDDFNTILDNYPAFNVGKVRSKLETARNAMRAEMNILLKFTNDKTLAASNDNNNINELPGLK